VTYETILVEQLDRVRRITLDRPEKRNALSSTLLAELLDAVEAGARDHGTHVLVLRGAGPSFSSGFDAGPVRPAPGEDVPPPKTIGPDLEHLLDVNAQLERLWSCRLPVIAQVHGDCLAGGTDLALHCDIVIVAADARIGYPPARFFGVPPSQMWIYSMGPQWTKRILWGGDLMSGTRAAELGCALEAVAADELDERVLRHARQIARTARDSLIGSKLVANQALELMGRRALQSFAATQDAVAHATPEALEFRRRVREQGIARATRDADRSGDDDQDLL
jgi:enoyl-CoA hydratase